MRNAYDPVMPPFLPERVDTIGTSRGWRSPALVLRLSGHLYSLLFAVASRHLPSLASTRVICVFNDAGGGQAWEGTHVAVPLPQFPLGRRPCAHTFQHVCQVIDTIPRHANRVKLGRETSGRCPTVEIMHLSPGSGVRHSQPKPLDLRPFFTGKHHVR